MNFGTIAYNNKIYNLEYMTLEQINELKSKIIANRKNIFLNDKKVLLESKDKNQEANDFISLRNEIDIIAKKETLVEMSYMYKLTEQIINQKVKSQLSTIKFNIKKINSKFNEKSKKYEIIQELLFDLISKYEETLRELAVFYDEKLMQLILRKFELEIILINEYGKQNKLLYLINICDKNSKNKLFHNIKRAISIVKEKKIMKNTKKNTCIKGDISKEKLEENKKKFEKINKEIYLLTEEIKKMNERKMQAILDAMESEEKSIITKLKRPKTFEKITRFFSSKINTPKVIIKNVIEPLNEKIQIFIETELSNKR